MAKRQAVAQAAFRPAQVEDAMHLSRRTVLLAAAGAAAVTLGAVALAMRGPMEPPPQDLSGELARAFDQLQSGALHLGPPSQVDRTVLDADGTPERNAPSFAPRKITQEGAATLQIFGRRAVLVAYRDDAEGRFAVLSLRGGASDLSVDAGVIEYEGRRFTMFRRAGASGPIHGVGAALGSRLVFVVGPQRLEQLASLLAVVPDV